MQARSLLEHDPDSRPQGAPVTDRIQAEDTHRAGIRFDPVVCEASLSCVTHATGTGLWLEQK